MQDASRWWEEIRALSREVLAEIPADRVVAVSCTGQWASTVPVDSAGEPVGPCITWLDTRGPLLARGDRRPVMGYAPGALVSWIRRTGGVPSPHGGDPVSHMLLIDREMPEVAAAARWYMEPVDYLTMRFTGRAVATHASMSGAWLTDNRRSSGSSTTRRSSAGPASTHPSSRRWSRPGRWSESCSRRSPPARDLPDAGGHRQPDLHSAAFGTGAIGEGEAHMTISTTSWISLPFPRKKTDALRSIATVPGLDSRSYLVADNHEAAGLCLRWLRGAFTRASRPASSGWSSWRRRAAGERRVIFTPWIAGERSPVDDRHARGGWHNVSASTTNAELIRAVLEGVAYNARWLNEAVERFAGRRLEPLRIFGGGAVSSLWCQIHADVMERTIERVAEPLHTNLRGGPARRPGAGCGRSHDVRDLVPVDRVFEPDSSAGEAYGRLYAEFPGLYKAQRKMFARLNR